MPPPLRADAAALALRERIVRPLLAALALAGLVALAALPPIAQDPAYHAFADARGWLGVPNALNVLSNAGFVAAGAIALSRAAGARGARARRLAVFGLALLGVGVGSAWYHAAPDDARLFWDRLPLAVALTATLAAAFADRLRLPSDPLLVMFVTFGAGSAIAWNLTGDLRPYVAAQFLSMALLTALVIVGPDLSGDRRRWLEVLGWYAVGKVAEMLDGGVLAATGVLSGHTVKHLTAAIGAWRAVDVVGGDLSADAGAPRLPGRGQTVHRRSS